MRALRDGFAQLFTDVNVTLGVHLDGTLERASGSAMTTRPSSRPQRQRAHSRR